MQCVSHPMPESQQCSMDAIGTFAQVSYADVDFSQNSIALVLGNEEIGVDTAVLQAADGVIEIPCFGSKNSLNVCSAASIVVFEALRQRGVLAR